MKTLYALALGLLLALGCGDRQFRCGDDDTPDGSCESFGSFVEPKEAVSLKCTPNRVYCCDTCGEDQFCLDFCIERKEP